VSATALESLEPASRNAAGPRTLRVLYIAGAGRSGSTILDRVLGSLPRVGSFNELNNVFEHGFRHNRGCACGQPFRACEYWCGVADRTGLDAATIERAIDLSRRFDRTRMFPALYSGLMRARTRAGLTEYRDILGRLLGAMSAQAGLDTIVDSSKMPTRALVLAGVPNIDVRVIHLVRDPRAVASAWRNAKFDPGKDDAMDRFSIRRTLMFWAVRQLLSERLGRRMPYLRLRYEDFAALPAAALQEVFGFVPGWSHRPMPVTPAGEVRLATIHSVSGNPDRFATGLTRIRLDQRWRDLPDARAVDRASRWIAPISRRYGY
jgi:hypothetical protein